MSRNTELSDNALTRAGLAALRERLPSRWLVDLDLDGARESTRARRRITVTAPDGRKALLALQPERRLEPRAVLQSIVGERAPDNARLVISPYLSAATRARLKEAGVAFLDLTGNARIELGEPGLFIETAGASVDPDRTARPTRSLRGAKAGRVVRVLIDSRLPPGVRELAKRANVDPGYVSRLLALLDSAALVERGARGSVSSVDWVRLLRRWAEDAPLSTRGVQASFLEPRGLSALWEKLRSVETRYAVTGTMAASRLAPVAPPRLAVIYVEEVSRVRDELGLRPATVGANVCLIEPGDLGVFEGARVDDGIQFVAPSQMAADLLTSPGRGPAEAEALLEWMVSNQDAWRG